MLQAHPVHIPSSSCPCSNLIFSSSQQNIYIFIWAQKPLQLSQLILRLSKLHSGKVLPDIIYYQAACQLNRVIDWCCHGTLKQLLSFKQTTSVVRCVPFHSARRKSLKISDYTLWLWKLATSAPKFSWTNLYPLLPPSCFLFLVTQLSVQDLPLQVLQP